MSQSFFHTAFEAHCQELLLAVEPLKGAGSNRRYYRLRGQSGSLIGVVGESLPENVAFIELTKHFKTRGLPVPALIAVSADSMQYIVQDLGDVSLFDYIKTGRETGDFKAADVQMLDKTIRKLARFQYAGAQGLDFSVCFPQPTFDRRTILWDLNYFKYCFLKPSGIPFSEADLEADFEAMAQTLLARRSSGGDKPTFMYRDFQSRNVMIVGDEPYFIDYQGGRRGPVYYDVASFLWQAKANYTSELRDTLLNAYLDEVAKYDPSVTRDLFLTELPHFLLFRMLQVLGAYGYRGFWERKTHFLESIPLAIRNLHELLSDAGFAEYPHLKRVLTALCASGKYENPQRHSTEKVALHIDIYSFSYRIGIPEDESGNGGGYIFDCRAIHNPGRYDEYKQLTGLDQLVIDFLEKDGEVIRFLEQIYPLAEQHINRYIERGFSHLMFSFGCTGGQHRSVYCAQRLAEYINSRFNVHITITHREQGISSEM